MLTPTQRRIMDVLSDGQPHPIEELLACQNDELSVGALHVQLHKLRKFVRERNEHIVRVLMYQHRKPG